MSLIWTDVERQRRKIDSDVAVAPDPVIREDGGADDEPAESRLEAGAANRTRAGLDIFASRAVIANHFDSAELAEITEFRTLLRTDAFVKELLDSPLLRDGDFPEPAPLVQQARAAGVCALAQRFDGPRDVGNELRALVTAQRRCKKHGEVERFAAGNDAPSSADDAQPQPQVVVDGRPPGPAVQEPLARFVAGEQWRRPSDYVAPQIQSGRYRLLASWAGRVPVLAGVPCTVRVREKKCRTCSA